MNTDEHLEFEYAALASFTGEDVEAVKARFASRPAETPDLQVLSDIASEEKQKSESERSGAYGKRLTVLAGLLVLIMA